MISELNLPSFSEREILVSNNFTCVVSVGQLAEGHCLIFAKRTILNLSELNFDERQELLSFVEIIANGLKEIYNCEILVFEQGAVSYNDNVGCGVNAAHLHLVPFDEVLLLNKYFEANNLKEISTSSLAGCFNYLSSQNEPYILLGSSLNGFSIYRYSGKRESQIIRREMAKILGKAVWDWKSLSDHSLLWQTFNKLKILNLQNRIIQ